MQHDEVTNLDPKEAWIQEQTWIASQVVVLPDDGWDKVDRIVEESRRFSLQSLAERLVVDDKMTLPYRYIGGVDVSYATSEAEESSCNSCSGSSVAVYVILDLNLLGRAKEQIVYQDIMLLDQTVEYIPSFLAYREVDPLEQLIRKQIQVRPDLGPDVILVDGNGIFHPRRAGIATVLGVRLNVPTVGVAKSLYCHGGLSKELVSQGLAVSLLAAKDWLVGNEDTLQTHQTDQLNSCMTPRPSFPVLLDEIPIRGELEGQVAESTTSTQQLDRKAILKSLYSLCHGLAVPLICRDTSFDTSSGDFVVACACNLVLTQPCGASGLATATTKQSIQAPTRVKTRS